MTIMDKEDDLLVNSHNKEKRKMKKTNISKKNIPNNQDNGNIIHKKKKSYLGYKILSFLLVVLTVITLGNIIFEGIFSFFYILPIILVAFFVLGILTYILNKSRLRCWIKNVFSVFVVLIMIFEILMLSFGTSTLKFISSITDTGYRVETFGLYVLNDSKAKGIEDLDHKKIYYLRHDDNHNMNEAIKKVKKQITIDTDYKKNASSLVDVLIKRDTDAILMDCSYETILEEENNEEYKKIRLVEKIDVVDTVDTIKSDVDIAKDPFAIYISGIDTTGNVSSSARSDVNLIIAVNPNTRNILMVNTPRDYYLTLASKKKKDKLTHAGLYGVEESLNSLKEFYEVDIDYYARINFTSFIKIVNELGGISVDVPIKFCEQNSKRSKAAGDLICLNKGVQNLNGEQALALARHRHTLATGDRGRGENQMLVLKAVINKAMSPKVVSKYNGLIDALNGRVTTNMQVGEVAKFAKKQLSGDKAWNFTTLSATGTDSTGVCYVTGAGKAYVMQPDEESVEQIKYAFDRLFDGESVIIENE